MASREVAEGTVGQGVDEIIAYTIDVSNWGNLHASPNITVVVWDDTGTNVTSIVMPSGTPSAVGNVITLPPLKLLTANTSYRVEVKFTESGNNVLECILPVAGEE